MPFVKAGPKGLKGALAGKKTPRQRAAICWPCDRSRGSEHPRYHKRNGGWQSILTFDLMPAPPHDADCDTLDDVHVGYPCSCEIEPRPRASWHARATTWPVVGLDMWTPKQRKDVKAVLRRLLKNVGVGELDIHKGGEEPVSMSIHFYREATMSEIAQCERSRRN